MKKLYLFLLLSVLFALPAFSQQQSDTAAGKEIHFGFSTDLLPYITAVITDETAYSIQGWVSVNRIKYRLVVADINMPESFLPDGTESHEIKVFALIADYYFKEISRGPWIGSGIELWKNCAEDEISGKNIKWNTVILTFGGGYKVMAGEHLYFNPFAAIHLNPAAKTIDTKNSSFDEKNIQSSASVKIGWMF